MVLGVESEPGRAARRRVNDGTRSARANHRGRVQVRPEPAAALGGAVAGLAALWLAAPAPLVGSGIQPFDHAHAQWTDILTRYVTAGQ